MTLSIVARCGAGGLRMTGQRRIIDRVLAAADHPDAESLPDRIARRPGFRPNRHHLALSGVPPKARGH